MAIAAVDAPERRRSGGPEHLPYPREGGREGLFRARPPAKAAERAARRHRARHGAGGSRLRRTGRGRAPGRARAVRRLVVGPQAYHRLPELLARRARAAGAVVDTEFPVESKFDRPPADQPAGGVGAFLTIQEGCDKFCTFCVVPYTRGAEQSRPAAASCARRRAWWPRGARADAARPERQRLHGDGPDGGPGASPACCAQLAEIPGSPGSATRPPIPATWTRI